MWDQVDQLFPRGSQPVAYDIAIGTGRGAIELAKRQALSTNAHKTHDGAVLLTTNRFDTVQEVQSHSC